MRVLWLPSACPLPSTDGNRQRHLHLLRAVARHHEVSLVTPATEAEASRVEELTELGLEVTPIAGPARSTGRVTAAVKRQPNCIVPSQIDLINDAVRPLTRRRFDAVVAALPLAPVAVRANARRTVIDDQNVEAELYRQLWQREPLGRRKVARFLDWRSVRAYERRWLAHADLVTVCSELDASRLTAIAGGRPVIAVPNGVSLNDVPYAENGRNQNELLMVGGMSWAPNVEAARLLVHSVMPAVWRERPAVHVNLVGKDPAPEVRALAGRRVTVTGEVQTTVPYLHQAALTVIPLMSGGGTRLKLLEAMAAGTPIVTTTIGAEGIALEHGSSAWVAPSVDGVSQGVITLLGDPGRARKMSARARRLAESSYGWDEIGGRFVRVLDELCHVPLA